MAGDATLFMRRDAVEASWAWITKILEGWQRQGLRWLPEYPAGTCGRSRPIALSRRMDGLVDFVAMDVMSTNTA